MLGRRAFLARLGIGAAAAPLAAKQVLEASAGGLAGINVSGLGASPPYGAPAAQQVGGSFDLGKAVRTVLSDAKLRDEYTSLMFMQHRSVGALDLDLAQKRSFSLAAKVTFQRQRNVARAIEENADPVPWYGRAEQLLQRGRLALPVTFHVER